MKLYLVKIVLPCLLFIAGAAQAALVSSGNVQAEIISENRTVKAGESFWVAVRQVIRKDWHTYWRNPGDSGAPTTLKWQLPPGFSASEIHWPYPERVPYGPLMNFGYNNEVVFPVYITVPKVIDMDGVTLRVKGRWLVCADICIPENAELELRLPVSQQTPVVADENVVFFRDARQKIPKVIGIQAEKSVMEDSIMLKVSMAGLEPSRIKSIDYFPYEEGVLEFPAPQKLSMDTLGFTLELKAGYAFDANESTLNGIIVVSEDAGHTAFQIEPLATGSLSSMQDSEMNFLLAMLFALLGGMILNLMPCVFPVLSIKFLSLVESTHSDSGQIRQHGIAYLFGVVLSFLAVAAVLIALRAGGEQIGWGFQLQSPIVIGILVYLFVLIGLNLSGYFEFGASMMDAGSGLASRGGYAGSFYTGVLATIVAAPCTAPFMGAAIGYALTLDALSSLLVFGALGLGMALPYVLLCFSPPLLNRLPKPGKWMETLKEVFAFPMFATAIWLVWVLNLQTGANGLLAILAGLLLISFAIWLSKRRGSGLGRLISNSFILALFVSALMLTGVVETRAVAAGVGSSAPKGESMGPESFLDAEPFSPERLQTLVAEGPVFVNFTAAWCITCKVNDLAALSTDNVKQAFEANNMRYLVGDWTNEDPVITRTLANYGRSGVPLYLVFAKGASRARVLPQILTESIVIAAINKAGLAN
ncbi:MAG: protein-disulfide reductase DsbD domain-containing protein [Pseudomonadales bacterium]